MGITRITERWADTRLGWRERTATRVCQRRWRPVRRRWRCSNGDGANGDGETRHVREVRWAGPRGRSEARSRPLCKARDAPGVAREDGYLRLPTAMAPRPTAMALLQRRRRQRRRRDKARTRVAVSTTTRPVGGSIAAALHGP